jgi:hypothetical protein
VAVVLLPADVWALHWFARSIRDEGEPALPDPDRPAVPEPTSNVRTPPRRTDPAEGYEQPHLGGKSGRSHLTGE